MILSFNFCQTILLCKSIYYVLAPTIIIQKSFLSPEYINWVPINFVGTLIIIFAE
jgi:hypothetical protein